MSTSGRDGPQSDQIGSAISRSSRVLGLLSMIPVLLVTSGLLIRLCISRRRRRKAACVPKVLCKNWKPVSLQLPTLLIYLAFIFMLIMLLESADLALREPQYLQEEESMDSLNDAIMQIATHFPDSNTAPPRMNSISPRSVETSQPGAPGPDIGWLLLGDGWLSAGTAYFIGTFLPLLIASIFAVPWKIIDLETKSLEPFSQLARPDRETAPKTVLRQFNNLSGLVTACVGIFTGEAAVALSTYLKYGAALLIPLAAESVHLALQGKCLQDTEEQCTAKLQVTVPVVRTAQALLAAMACLVVAYMILLQRRTFGVSSDPRSILGIASLSLNPHLVATFQRISLGPDGTFSSAQASKVLGKRRFRFDHIILPSGQQEYAINIDYEPGDSDKGSKTLLPVPNRKPSRLSSISGLLAKVIGFATFIIGLIVLILYYRLTYLKGSGFENFMDSQTFGTRFLFTIFGVVIGLGWASIFTDLAMLLPAWEMTSGPARAERSIMMPLSPNPYVGIITHFRKKYYLLALASFATVLSEFLPISLANIPFSNATTWTTFNVCTWVSIGVLGFFVIILAAIVWVMLKASPSRCFPFKSADWGTIAAVLYLTCRSPDLLTQLQGFSLLEEKEIEKRMKMVDARYLIADTLAEDGHPHFTIRVVQ